MERRFMESEPDISFVMPLSSLSAMRTYTGQCMQTGDALAYWLHDQSRNGFVTGDDFHFHEYDNTHLPEMASYHMGRSTVVVSSTPIPKDPNKIFEEWNVREAYRLDVYIEGPDSPDWKSKIQKKLEFFKIPPKNGRKSATQADA